MDIFVVNRQPIPAVYNVKQYSDAAYSFVFHVPLSELPNGNVVSAAVKTSRFTKVLDIETADDMLVMAWSPDITQTSAAGKFDIQLEITGSGFVWQSYKAAYIVSSSLIYDPIVYELTDGALSEALETNVSAYVLFPDLVLSETGYEWKEGHNVKTFYETAAKTNRIYFKIEKDEIKIYSKALESPVDITDIAQAQTELLSVNSKQLYFVSLDDFSAGLTTVSPRMRNKAMSEYTEDMYKCRCLKAVGSEVLLMRISAAVTAAGKSVSMVYPAGGNSEYGTVIRDDGESVKVYKKYNGNEYEDIIFKVYDSEAAADADAQNMPEGSVGIIKR
ncbi:MAG: hypothetical protein IKS17_10240 [Firmicutes bacterium]|nr:hypothetical protein [Bacillota bacterium]